MKNQKGFSLVELLVVVIIIAIIAAIAIPNLLASRRAANEGSAVNTLRTYHSAQATFQALSTTQSYALNAAGLGTLVDTTLAGAAPVAKSGYNFAVVGEAAAGATASVYCADADPQNTSTGTRFFGISSGNGGVVVTNATTLDCQASGALANAGTPLS